MNNSIKISTKDIKTAIKDIENDSWSFREISEALRRNYDVAFAAAKDFSYHFEYVAEPLKYDRKFSSACYLFLSRRK
jgi:hypothetical protein